MHSETGGGDSPCLCMNTNCDFCEGNCTGVVYPQIRLGDSHLAAWGAEDHCAECRRAYVLAHGLHTSPIIDNEQKIQRRPETNCAQSELTDATRNLAILAPWRVRCSTCDGDGPGHVVEPCVSVNVSEAPDAKFTKCTTCRLRDARALDTEAYTYNAGLPRLPMSENLQKAVRFDGGRLPDGYERRDRVPKTHSMPASVPHRNEFLPVTLDSLDTNVTDININMEFADRPQTGSIASVLPKFHMIPAYGVGEDGQFLGLVNPSTGALLTPDEADTETQLYARLAAADARACVVHGHKLHQCCATCFKNKGSKLCRFRCYRAVTAALDQI